MNQNTEHKYGKPGFVPWVEKIPQRRERLPTPVFWPGKFHVEYSPWGHKESDTAERLSFPQFFSYSIIVSVQLCKKMVSPGIEFPLKF